MDTTLVSSEIREWVNILPRVPEAFLSYHRDWPVVNMHSLSIFESDQPYCAAPSLSDALAMAHSASTPEACRGIVALGASRPAIADADVLVPFLRHEEPWRRCTALLALDRWQTDLLAEALERAGEDPDYRVRLAAFMQACPFVSFTGPSSEPLPTVGVDWFRSGGDLPCVSAVAHWWREEKCGIFGAFMDALNTNWLRHDPVDHLLLHDSAEVRLGAALVTNCARFVSLDEYVIPELCRMIWSKTADGVIDPLLEFLESRDEEVAGAAAVALAFANDTDARDVGCAYIAHNATPAALPYVQFGAGRIHSGDPEGLTRAIRQYGWRCGLTLETAIALARREDDFLEAVRHFKNTVPRI